MPTRDRQMYSAEADITEFNGLRERLEKIEANRIRTNVEQARKNIAERLGVTYNTIENFRRRRLKVVPHWLMLTAREKLEAVLKSEMNRLAHDIQIHRQTRGSHRDDALVSAQAQMAKVRELLNGG